MSLFVIASDEDDREVVQFADYEPMLSAPAAAVGPEWRAPRATLVQRDRGRKLAPADFPWSLGRVLVSKPSAAPLAREFSEHVELVQLNVGGAGPPLWWWHILSRPVDLLDESTSDIGRLPDGRPIELRRPSFHPAVAAHVRIAQLPARLGGTYVCNDFVALYKKLGLTGLRFLPV